MLLDWFESLTLGFVQGVTEFLPVSSKGHLTITQQLFDWIRARPGSGEERVFFDVMLHFGTLMAIFAHYRAVIVTGTKGLLGSETVPPAYRRSSLFRVALLMILATIPAGLIGVLFEKQVKAVFANTQMAAFGFIFTAFVLAWTGRVLATVPESAGRSGPLETTWRDALLIGLAQGLAIFPGVSRSGMTVAAALLVGFSRNWAVGFSLMMATPVILGATTLELVKDFDPSTVTKEEVLRMLSAMVVAGVVGYAAILSLVRVVRSGRLWYFSVYLLILAALVLGVIWNGSGEPREQPSATLDRPVRDGSGRAVDRASGLESLGSLDRPIRSGQG